MPTDRPRQGQTARLAVAAQTVFGQHGKQDQGGRGRAEGDRSPDAAR